MGFFGVILATVLCATTAFASTLKSDLGDLENALDRLKNLSVEHNVSYEIKRTVGQSVERADEWVRCENRYYPQDRLHCVKEADTFQRVLSEAQDQISSNYPGAHVLNNQAKLVRGHFSDILRKWGQYGKLKKSVGYIDSVIPYEITGYTDQEMHSNCVAGFSQVVKVVSSLTVNGKEFYFPQGATISNACLFVIQNAVEY